MLSCLTTRDVKSFNRKECIELDAFKVNILKSIKNLYTILFEVITSTRIVMCHIVDHDSSLKALMC
jgi:hypothetical protein